ncbi:MAG: ornithine cyclodeaminase family protein [Thermodesulfobacteriota bacterium]
MLILNEGDIRTAVSLEEIMDEVENALRLGETGDYVMPLRTYLEYEGNSFLLMPCFTPPAFGAKLVTVFPRNPEKGRPVIESLMVLNNAATGETLALLNGKALTALRTGAVGGVAVRRLSPDQPHALGLIGAGVQGFQQARFAAATGKIDRILVHDRLADKVPDFVQALAQAVPDVPVARAESAEALLESCRTVIAATTSNEPVLPDRPELLAGRHFVGIGSYRPTMREFPEALFHLVERVWVDTVYALEESGDLTDPLQKGWLKRDQVETLGRFLLEPGDRRPRPGQTTLFKSVGMALFDVLVSWLIYRKALEKGLGREVAL